jgi:hypothetical protein
LLIDATGNTALVSVLLYVLENKKIEERARMAKALEKASRLYLTF